MVLQMIVLEPRDVVEKSTNLVSFFVAYRDSISPFSISSPFLPVCI